MLKDDGGGHAASWSFAWCDIIGAGIEMVGVGIQRWNRVKVRELIVEKKTKTGNHESCAPFGFDGIGIGDDVAGLVDNGEVCGVQSFLM